jgi:hypothetical protein
MLTTLLPQDLPSTPPVLRSRSKSIDDSNCISCFILCFLLSLLLLSCSSTSCIRPDHGLH